MPSECVSVSPRLSLHSGHYDPCLCSHTSSVQNLHTLLWTHTLPSEAAGFTSGAASDLSCWSLTAGTTWTFYRAAASHLNIQP